MTISEREKQFNEASRNLNNASEILRTKANKKDGYYHDTKYTRMACGTAYNAVLLALDTYLLMKGKPKNKQRKSVEYYQLALSKIDLKVLQFYNSTYYTLHLNGYYEGLTDYELIRVAFIKAAAIINQIKPEGVANLEVN